MISLFIQKNWEWWGNISKLSQIPNPTCNLISRSLPAWFCYAPGMFSRELTHPQGPCWSHHLKRVITRFSICMSASWCGKFPLPSSRAYALWTSNTPFTADYRAINLHIVNDIECLGTESDQVSRKNAHKVSF